MRTLPISLFLALSLAAPASFAHDGARKDDPWYIQFGIGAVSAADTDALDTTNSTVTVGFDTGVGMSLAIGRDMGGGEKLGWSIEGEALYTSYNLSEGDLVNFTTTAKGAGAFALMGNIVLDWHMSDTVAWYLGGGVGYATSLEMESLDTGSLTQLDKDGLAGQVKTGFRYHLGNLTDVMLGYRFFGTEGIDIAQGATTAEAQFQNHMLEVMFRWGW